MCVCVCVCTMAASVCVCKGLVCRCICIHICIVIYVCLWACVCALCVHTVLHIMCICVLCTSLCTVYLFNIIQIINLICMHYGCKHAYYVFAWHCVFAIEPHQYSYTNPCTHKHTHKTHTHVHTHPHPHPHTEAPHTATIVWQQKKPATQCEHPSQECQVLNVAPYMKTRHSVIPHHRVFVVSG